MLEEIATHTVVWYRATVWYGEEIATHALCGTVPILCYDAIDPWRAILVVAPVLTPRGSGKLLDKGLGSSQTRGKCASHISGWRGRPPPRCTAHTGTEVSVSEEGSTSPFQDGLDENILLHDILMRYNTLHHISSLLHHIASRCIIILLMGGLDQQNANTHNWKR